MTMIRTLLLGSTLVLAPVMAHAQTKMPASADQAAPAMAVDKASFVKVVSSANLFEIESSRLAEEKATSDDVKTFAREMIADHTKAGTEMKDAAKLPADDKPALAPKHAAMMKLLQEASGAEFQALYIDMQMQAHNEAVMLFATYAKGGDDAALKTFAGKTLPVLEKHREHVMRLVEAQ